MHKNEVLFGSYELMSGSKASHQQLRNDDVVMPLSTCSHGWGSTKRQQSTIAGDAER